MMSVSKAHRPMATMTARDRYLAEYQRRAGAARPPGHLTCASATSPRAEGPGEGLCRIGLPHDLCSAYSAALASPRPCAIRIALSARIVLPLVSEM